MLKCKGKHFIKGLTVLLAVALMAVILPNRAAVLAAEINNDPTITFFDYWTVEIPEDTSTMTFIVETANIPDGQYAISVQGLPAGVTAPEYAEVANDEFLLRLTNFSEAAIGFYSIMLAIYNEDGTVIATTAEALLLSVYDPAAIEIEIEADTDLPEIDIVAIETHDYEYAYNDVSHPEIDRDMDDYVRILNEVLSASDAAPFTNPENNLAMVPLRIVAEGLGAAVSWDEATRTATINKDNFSVSLQVDTPLPQGMGLPLIVEGRTFVPVDLLSLTLGLDIGWDAVAEALYIQAEG
ncbi:MAG: copper amine oxidase N-terminal domain-containing protein [Defluviitaleaceae bacterium]|nr:copper amine oxidase N-terminal domain-containing protein [Defluviitaleaceae bacterium]